MSANDVLPASRIADAYETFAKAGTIAMVWADQDLIVREAHGQLPVTLESGTSLIDAMPVFYGFEEDLAAIRCGRQPSLEIPNISIVLGPNVTPRINISVRWSEQSQAYLVLVARTLSREALEQELQQQVRGRRLAEEILIEQAEQIHATNVVLEQVNRDLAEFAHVVSHDLKAPMRALRYFAEDLETSLIDPTAGDPRDHLARMKAQSRRMTEMLSSLLAYARLEQKSGAIAECNTFDLVNKIVRSLAHEPDKGVAVTGDWPRVETIEALLDVVLRNLIDNALKYSAPAESAVQIVCARTQDGLSINITDNGPGIAPAHQDAVFEPFTQLEPCPADTTDAPGTGMGLALVRRAVAGVEGRIWIESDPATGPGTTFWLVWPCRIAATSGHC